MNNEQMKARILDFGIPPIEEFCNKHLQILFADEEITGTTERGYHCNVDDVKFCLYDLDNRKPIFSMDFFALSPRVSAIMKTGIGRSIKLELLYVHDASLRMKGIASYYIRQLQKYALENKFESIVVHPNSNAKNFKGNRGLPQAQLEEFYNHLSKEDMPIIMT